MSFQFGVFGFKFRLALNECFDQFARLIVGELLRRRFHEITRRTNQWPANAALQREFSASHRINHNARGIRRIPDFQFQFAVQRHIAKRRSFHADVTPLAILEPRNVIARADVRLRV